MDSTASRPLLFVTREPAWEATVTLEQSLASDVQTSRAGYEQRHARQKRSRWRLAYDAVLGQDDHATRRAAAAAEISSPLVVPFWTEQATAASAINPSREVLLDRPSTVDWFAAGDWVYVDNGTESQFRLITAVNTSNAQRITLADGDDPIAIPEGATIWPCRICFRQAGKAERQRKARHATTEQLTFVTL